MSAARREWDGVAERLRRMRAHSGQAVVESLLAVLIVTTLFFGFYSLSRLLMDKVMVEHAAMRVARARAVGLNRFWCTKAARVAAIPVSGRRLHPDKDDERGYMDESALARMYMRTIDSTYADGLLRYEHWCRLGIVPGSGEGDSSVSLKTDWATVRGSAKVDSFPVYMSDQGL